MLDIRLEIEEVRLNLGSIPRKMVIYYPCGERDQNWPRYFHEVIRITSITTKKQWIIDITGAQYGINRALWTWQEYRYPFKAEVKAIYPFGTNKAALKAASRIAGSPSMSYGAISVVADHLAIKLDERLTRTGKRLSQLVHLSQREFASDMRQLLEFMSDTVHTFVRANDFQEEFEAMMMHEEMYPGVSI